MANTKKINQKGAGYQTYEDRHDTTKELDWDTIEDLIYNAEQGRTDFPSYVLDASDFLDPGAGSQQGTYIYARLRPKYYDHQAKPSPCEFDDPEQQFICLSDHPIAFSETKAGDTRTMPLSPGDTVTAYWEQGPEYGGSMRRLRFYLDKVSRNNAGNYDFKCLKIKTRKANIRYPKNKRPRKPNVTIEDLKTQFEGMKCDTHKIPKDKAEPIPANLWHTVLHKVIARDGASKSFDDVKAIDGGTVGIAHFAASSLRSFVRRMGSLVPKYFGGRSASVVANMACTYGLGNRNNKKISDGQKKNEAGQQGCYGLSWWRSGMKKMLKDPKSIKLQETHWKRRKWDPMVAWMNANAPDKCYTSRHYAIVVGIANSLGNTGAMKIGRANNYDPEAMLDAYIWLPLKANKSKPKLQISYIKHRIRRAQAIVDTFECGK